MWAAIASSARSEFVALAEQHAECALALPAISRRRGEAPTQDRERSSIPPPRVLLVLGERVFDDIGIDTAGTQDLPNPVSAPLVELTLVLDEQAREPGVVQMALLDERLDRALGVPRVDALALEVRAHLRPRALTRAQIAVRDRER